jgi:hypothetical protein
MLRCVVIATYLPDDRPSREDIPESQNPCVTVDAVPLHSRYKSVLRDVPVLVRSGGLNDHEVWVPRAASVAFVGGASLAIDPKNPATATDLSQTDGDHVLIGFLGNDLNEPVVLGQLPHPRTKRRPSRNDAPAYISRTHTRGIETAVLSSGDVEIDFTNASAGTINADGVEVADGGGKLTLRFKNGLVIEAHPTNGLTISLGTVTLTHKFTVDAGGAGPQPVILGTSFLTDLLSSLSEINGMLTSLLGGSAPPITTAFLVQLTAALTPVRAPYLSARTETE